MAKLLLPETAFCSTYDRPSSASERGLGPDGAVFDMCFIAPNGGGRLVRVSTLY